MRKSKLESYAAILEVLMEKPLGVDRLSYALNGNCAIVKKRLSFLMKNRLVENQVLGKRKVFAITERGEAVSRTLHLQKHMDKLKTTVIAMNENPELVSVPVKQRNNAR